jgi:uncharacterized membrane protein YedE/YeeE
MGLFEMGLHDMAIWCTLFGLWACKNGVCTCNYVYVLLVRRVFVLVVSHWNA